MQREKDKRTKRDPKKYQFPEQQQVPASIVPCLPPFCFHLPSEQGEQGAQLELSVGMYWPDAQVAQASWSAVANWW